MPTPTATLFLPYHALDDVILRGTRAAQPLASAVVAGTLYGVTDEGNALERSTGSVWQAYSPTGGGGAPAAHHVSHEPGGSDALAALSASTLTSGTVADARLSSNVALRDTKNYFSDDQFIQKPGASVRLIDTNGAVNQRLWVMGCDLAPDFYFQSRTDAGAITANAAIFRRNGDVEIGKDVYEKGRLTPMGHWIAVPYTAAAFHSETGTWTVPSGGVIQNVYTLLGKLMIWGVQINGATLAGAGLFLYLDTPPGLTIATILPLPAATATEGTGAPVDALVMPYGANVAVRKASNTPWLDGSLNYVYFTALVQLA